MSDGEILERAAKSHSAPSPRAFTTCIYRTPEQLGVDLKRLKYEIGLSEPPPKVRELAHRIGSRPPPRRGAALSLFFAGLILDCLGLASAFVLTGPAAPLALILAGTGLAYWGVTMARRSLGDRDDRWRRIERMIERLPVEIGSFTEAGLLANRDGPRAACILSTLWASFSDPACCDQWDDFLASGDGREWSSEIAAFFEELNGEPPDFWESLPCDDDHLKGWLPLTFEGKRGASPLLALAASARADRALGLSTISQLVGHPAPRLREIGIGELWRHESPESLDTILALLVESEFLDVRREVSEILSRRRDDNIIEVIAIALVDEDLTVRANAARALKGRKESQKLVFLLESALLDSETVRRQAIEALSTCNSERAVALLASSLDDSARSVRESAVIGLAMQEERDPSGRALRNLSDAQVNVYRLMKDDLLQRRGRAMGRPDGDPAPQVDKPHV